MEGLAAALREVQGVETVHLLRLVDQAALLLRAGDVADEGAGVGFGQAQNEIVRDGGIQRGVEIPCFLRCENERNAVFPAFLGHGGDEFQVRGAVGFVEYEGVGDARAQAAPEHVLVEAVEDEKGECALEFVVLRRVDADDDGAVAVPQAPAGFAGGEEAVVLEFAQPAEEAAEALVGLGVGAQYLYEAPERRSPRSLLSKALNIS